MRLTHLVLNQDDSARRVKESAYNLTFGKDQPPSDLLCCKVDHLIRGVYHSKYIERLLNWVFSNSQQVGVKNHRGIEINARKDVHFNNRYSCMERSRKMHPICQIWGDFSQVFIQICKDYRYLHLRKCVKECTTGIKPENVADPTQKLRGSRYDFVQFILYILGTMLCIYINVLKT